MQQNVVGNNYESTELVDLHNTGLNTNCAGIELCKHARLLDLRRVPFHTRVLIIIVIIIIIIAGVLSSLCS